MQPRLQRSAPPISGALALNPQSKATNLSDTHDKTTAKVKDLASQAKTQDGKLLDLEALQAEVHKWQERVPKLAAALRERSEELEQAKQQLREYQKAETADARLAARDQLIAELESKLAEAGAQQRELAGQLHTAQLENQAGASEAASWKEKWQSVTATLDDCVAEKHALTEKLAAAESVWQDNETTLLQQTQDMQTEFLKEINQLNEHIEQGETDARNWQQQAEQHAAAVERLEGELKSLNSRNKTLKDSVELANNQMASMGEELQQLTQQVAQLNGDLEQTQREREQAVASSGNLQQDNLALTQRLAQAEQSAAELDQSLRTCWARDVQDLQQLNTQQQEQIEELQQETVDVVSRLTEEARSAARAREDAVQSLEALKQQAGKSQEAAATASSELEKLKHQLNERSNLVRELETEMQTLRDTQSSELDRLRQAAEQKQQIEGQLLEAKNRADTHKQHAAQLERKQQQQMELLTQLEDELSEAQRQTADATREAEDRLRATLTQLAEANEHKEELSLELEGLRQEASAGDGNPAADEILGLQQKISQQSEELEALRASLAEAPRRRDDLTTIKGVGSKLARQLHELGYDTYQQIAELSPQLLDQSEHPLHGMRSRITRDQWITQAQELLGADAGADD